MAGAQDVYHLLDRFLCGRPGITLFPLDAIRNAAVSQQIEPLLSNLRDRVATHPWASDSEEPDRDDVLYAFDMARPRMNVLFSLLHEHRGARGADISTGLGFLPVLLHGGGFHITATECDPTAGGFASSTGLTVLPYCIGKDRIPFASQSLDFVVFGEVLEHLRLSPVSVIEEIVAPLRAGGTFVLTTPNIARRAHVEALVAGENFLEPFPEDLVWGIDATDSVEHVREYSVREVVESVEAAGLAVRDVLMTGWGENGYDLLPNPYANEIIVVRATR